ncbi:flavin monoamine oxidase family protein [Sinorhizobium americanum]|uniref:Flavin-containing monoamine oxidase A n=1 Tax=Sinorhizobium americanum TaxID=194963 RepID=A0A1L3LUC4_9HYPH|nr:FAD-dependent oxidoreductase [Sinorhizobium americanum]APG87157.1 flavin-containing monoamine oxidase A [Sinorhizobium americanum CCGM7]APG93672.1 flavin-containing monoamine oxidase A [Sinorhizobium americanum]OAP48941.1 amine oxidase [Sinorhizobium americanum]
MSQSILIVGGGLAGLTAARLLHRAGIGFKLLEARDRLGGRILSVDGTGKPSGDGFDLGPSWFWPGMQPAMGDLVHQLGLHHFEQNSDGDVIFQRMAREAPQRYRGMRQEPQSMRLVGGTGAIISALAESLPAESIELGAQVTHVSLDGEGVVVQYLDATGSAQRERASHVLFAMPPRLIEAKILFSPALDFATLERWQRTPTWMAPHAKFFALYDRPFWREAGLSGTAQSMVGPLVEIHDATTASGRAALFGFVGVPAAERAAAGRDAIVAASVQQLAQMFGPEAASPRATLFKDWADDPLTATSDDRQAGGHPSADPRPWINGKWRDYISLAGSETSISEPGYLAGAVEAATRTASELIGRLRKSEGQAFPAVSDKVPT